MKVLTVRNVNQALPRGLALLSEIGSTRESRYGQVLQAPCPVSTVYTTPIERVVFWQERDANPFFHLYESLWMLAGRNDLEPLQRYVKEFGQFSDDGKILHGAYGYRWRYHFGEPGYTTFEDGLNKTTRGKQLDQLVTISNQLKTDPTDRRCVLGMWDPKVDLGRIGKDLPCNDTATFQIGADGMLHLVVFCRSNDIVWGAYGANAVHFSFLLEYMAHWIGVPMGTYTQVSVNWHGYKKTLEQVWGLRELAPNVYDRYEAKEVKTIPIPDVSHEELDEIIRLLLAHADSGFTLPPGDLRMVSKTYHAWEHTIFHILMAHEMWRTNKGPERYLNALSCLSDCDPKVDWVVAAREWLERRQVRGTK